MAGRVLAEGHISIFQMSSPITNTSSVRAKTGRIQIPVGRATSARGHTHGRDRPGTVAGTALHRQADRAGHDFCRPGGDRHRERALFDDVQKRTAELTELLDQQTATSEVLRVISRSPGDLKPVFRPC